MAREVLHVLQSHVLLQKVGDGRHAERVGRERIGKPRRLEPPLHHPADVDAAHRPGGEWLGPADGGAEEGALGDDGRFDVGGQELLQVVPDGDLPRLAALLGETQGILRPVVLQALEGQLGHGPDPAGRPQDVLSFMPNKGHYSA